MGPKPELVHIHVSMDAAGVLRRVFAEGHAGRLAAGNNLVCAAVTVLLRSLFDTWLSYPDLVLEGIAPAAGNLSFELKQYQPAQAVALKASGDVLLCGLSRLQHEYPALLNLVIESKGGSYGT